MIDPAEREAAIMRRRIEDRDRRRALRSPESVARLEGILSEGVDPLERFMLECQRSGGLGPPAIRMK